ncbi:MAG TPA: DUF3618 domain-containing protein [Dissulfurispiraceae bacterium]
MDERTDVTRTPSSSGRKRDPDELKAEIERTRAEMSETVDAIQDKLSPEHIRGQVKHKVREATIGRAREMANRTGDRARDIGSNIVETVRRNPVPAAMVGLGLGWLIVKGPNHRYRALEGGRAKYRQKAGEIAGNARERASEFTATMREKAGETIGSAREKAGQISEQVHGKAEDISGMARERAQQAQGWFQDMLENRPLMAGALVLAIGALVGFSLPETSKEEEFMGEARDTLVGKAKEVAQETMQKAQRVAEKVQHTAKEEAQKEGVLR